MSDPVNLCILRLVSVDELTFPAFYQFQILFSIALLLSQFFTKILNSISFGNTTEKKNSIKARYVDNNTPVEITSILCTLHVKLFWCQCLPV